LNGVDHYLGPWNSPQSKAEYDRIIAEWMARGRRLPADDNNRHDFLVKELTHGYRAHLLGIQPKLEDKQHLAFKIVNELYGNTPATKFDVMAFKAIRLKLIEAGLAVTTIRDRMGVIRRMVAWGVENEMLPADALQRIVAVAGIRAGRDGVKPSKKVKPAPEEDIDKILPYCSPTIRAMIELQRFTGMRPQEVRLITTGQIDRTSDPWIYSPTQHKTLHRGKDRIIPLGPRAQSLLAGLLKADPDAPLFSPAEAREAFIQGQREKRKSKVPPSQKNRRKKNPKRKPGRVYDRHSYAHALERACLKAGVPVFRPNQIRHKYATKVRREHGLEAAQVLLGHTKADVTQVYAERDLALALDVAKKIG
jgi:integrase